MDEPRNDSKRSFDNAWIWFLIFSFVYVLSIGPAAGLLQASKASPKAEGIATILYYPVILAAEKSGHQDLLVGYIELWCP